MKHYNAIDAVSATQNQYVATSEARNAIERDLKWHRRYGRAGRYRFGNDASWQAVIVEFAPAARLSGHLRKLLFA